MRNGFAGLWWRVDGRESGVDMILDNMNDRGPRGTTDWTEYAIEMDVPLESVNINFGVILSASGTAWFDDLQVSLDGEPFDATSFDFGYEKGGIRHYVSDDEDFRGELDGSVLHSGRHSLRLASVAKAPSITIQPKRSRSRKSGRKGISESLVRPFSTEGGTLIPWRWTNNKCNPSSAKEIAGRIATCQP